MRIKEIMFFLFCIIMLIGCKKDKLQGEKQVFIGEWQWSHSYYEGNKCSQCCIEYDTIKAINSNNQFRLKFMSKGKMNFIENNNNSETFRIVFDDFVKNGDNSYIFDIHLNGDSKNVLHGRVNPDSLYTWDYPYESDDQNCFNYQNYFIKQ